MKMPFKEFAFVVVSFIFAASLCYLSSSCHALVVADKLYYQGSVGKTSTEPSDTTIETLTREIYD